MQVLFGFESESRREGVHVLYAGNDGDELEKAIAENKDIYPGIYKTQHGIEFTLIPVQSYSPEHPAVKAKAKAEAEAKAKAEAEAKAEAPAPDAPAADAPDDTAPKSKRKNKSQ